jgi:transcriptional regulator with XRE-family HTH domain
MTFGERLRSLRAVAGLSQSKLAKRAKVPQPVISALEANKQTTVNLDTASRLADALGVTLDLLAGRTGETQN